MPSPPAADTAAASCPVLTPAMGADTTGTVSPNRSFSHVRTDDSLPFAAEDATEPARPRGRRHGGEQSCGPGPWLGHDVAPGVVWRVPEEVAGLVDGVEGLVAVHLAAHFHPVVEALLDLLRRRRDRHVGVGDVEDLVTQPIGVQTALDHLT